MHVTTLPPGQDSHPPHRHPAEEVVIVREGSVDFYINGAVHHAGPGSFVLLASMEEHMARNVGSTPAVYYVMQWKTPATAATLVVPDSALDVNLLGMSFLSHVRWTHESGRLVLEQ